jgi:hypothetical protein
MILASFLNKTPNRWRSATPAHRATAHGMAQDQRGHQTTITLGVTGDGLTTRSPEPVNTWRPGA